MINVVIVSDYTHLNVPANQGIGGAELSDKGMGEALLRENSSIDSDPINVSFITWPEFTPNIDNFYILTNRTTATPKQIDYFINSGVRYILVEHDWQILTTRNPWITWGKDQYKRVTNPMIKPQLWMKSLGNFCQTDFHAEKWKIMLPEADFISLECSFFSVGDSTLNKTTDREKTSDTAIIYSSNPIKGTLEAAKYCNTNDIKFDAIPYMPRTEFLKTLRMYKRLVFIPGSPESCCRLVIEARLLGLEVITTYNYGASTSKWFNMESDKLDSYLAQVIQANACRILRIIHRKQ